MKRWKHQIEAVEFSRTRPNIMLKMAMGTGKTATAIDIIHTEPGPRVVLVVCPKSVQPTWEEQLRRWAPSPDEWMVVRTDGEERLTVKAQKVKQALSMAATMRKSIMIVTHYEIVHSTFMKDVLNRHKHWDFAIFDESHKLKGADSACSKWAANFVRQRNQSDILGMRVVRRIILLTGTPAHNTPADLYGQFRTLDPTILASTHQQFKNRYIQTDQYNRFIGMRNAEEFRRRIASVTFECGSDVISLPDSLDVDVNVKLDAKTTKMLRDMTAKLIAEYDGGIITAKNAMVSVLRLQQISNGCAPTIDESGAQKPKRIHTCKMNALRDLLESLGDQPVPVFCRFRSDLDMVREVSDELWGKGDYSELSGMTNDLQRWKDGHGHILGVQIQAGSAGVDLTRACVCICFSLSHSLGDYEQLRARIHRPGQTRNVTYYHMIGDGTVDRAIMATLKSKADTNEAVINNLRRDLEQYT